MKKLLSTTLALAFIVTALIGCAPSDNGTASPVAEKNVTKYTTEGKTTKLVGDPNATGELLISCYSWTKAITGEGEAIQIDDHISLATKKFKELYPNVEIVVNRAEEGMSQPEYRQKLSAEIMAGKGPDIFFVEETNMDVNKMIKSGKLANMYEYFENDKSFNIDDFNATVFSGGQPSKSQYIVPISYDIPMYLSTKKVLKKVGIDVAKMDNYLSFLYETNKALQKEETKDFPPIWDGVSPFLEHSGIDRYNFENGTVNLEALELKSIFELQKIHYEKYTNNSMSVTYDATRLVNQLKDSKLLFFQCSSELFGDYSMFAELNQFEKEPVLLPIRNMRGKISVTPSSDVAVNVNSKNKQNAYNFLKVLIHPEILTTRGIPIANEAFEVSLKKQVERYSEYDSNLEFLDEYIKQYKALINDVDEIDWYKNADWVLRDEMQPYYSGDKSYEECIKKAKERLEIYISE